MPNASSLERIARRFDIRNIPDSWFPCWDAFLSWRSEGKCGELQWELPSNAATVFDLPAESLDDLREMYRIIREDVQLAELADFWHYMIYHMPGGMDRNTNIWQMPKELAGRRIQLFYLAVMVSGADHALGNFAKTGVEKEVVQASLGYIGRYALDIRQKRGVWGIESVGWLSTYARAEIFRLGRLTFKEGVFTLPFRAFRNKVTGKIVTLCEPSQLYRGDGVADGTNGVYDPNAWKPVLEISESGVTGHPVSDDCTAMHKTVMLPSDMWEQVMTPEDHVIEVHIAGGSRLVHDECVDSFRAAVEFFPSYYTGDKFTAFTCQSWLFDPAFPRILPSDSNIVDFQRFFHVVPTLGSSAQTYDIVFGDSNADPTMVACTTRLQQALSEHVAAGGEIRSASGFITWEEAVSL